MKIEVTAFKSLGLVEILLTSGKEPTWNEEINIGSEEQMAKLIADLKAASKRMGWKVTT